MAPSGRQKQPGPRALSRRGMLKGAAVTAGAAALGLAGTQAAHAADAVMTATSPDGSHKITVSLVGGALS